MKIDEVFKAVHKLKMDVMKNNMAIEPDIAIYMDCEYLFDCMADYPVSGQVSSEQYEFRTYGTILGYPVWSVVESMNGKRPAPFRVVCYNIQPGNKP